MNITKLFIARCVALLACAIIYAGRGGSLESVHDGALTLIDWLMEEN